MNSIPVQIERVRSLEQDVAEVHEMIANRAYQKFLNRDERPGNAMEDWLAAEAELIAGCTATVRIENKQVIAEIVLPHIDSSTLAVKITPWEMLVFSTPGENGCRVFKPMQFQQEIETSGLEAEYVLDTLFVVAAIRNSDEESRIIMQVA